MFQIKYTVMENMRSCVSKEYHIVTNNMLQIRAIKMNLGISGTHFVNVFIFTANVNNKFRWRGSFYKKKKNYLLMEHEQKPLLSHT